MTPDFNAADTTTWPMALTADQVAAIYQRRVGGLKKACQQHRFVPAPFLVQPYRWRKVDCPSPLRRRPRRRTPEGGVMSLLRSLAAIGFFSNGDFGSR